MFVYQCYHLYDSKEVDDGKFKKFRDLRTVYTDA